MEKWKKKNIFPYNPVETNIYQKEWWLSVSPDTQLHDLKKNEHSWKSRSTKLFHQQSFAGKY